MIVAARMKGREQHALTIGHYAETFARTKRLRPLAKLLEDGAPPAEKVAAGAAKATALFRHIKRKQKADGASPTEP